MKLTLKDQIELVVIGDNNYEIVAPKGYPPMGTVGVKPQMVKNLVELCKQWAFETVGELKTVKDIFPEVIHEPTKEFAEQVMHKDGYNHAIRDICKRIVEAE